MGEVDLPKSKMIEEQIKEQLQIEERPCLLCLDETATYWEMVSIQNVMSPAWQVV